MWLHFLSSCGLDGTAGWPLIIRSCTSPSVLDKIGDEICRIRSLMQSQEADSFKQKMHLLLGG